MMKTSIAAVGDIILIEPIPADYDYAPIRHYIERADLRLFNLESVLADEPAYASSYCGGTWLVSETARLDDALKFGFNGCGWANNHTMDYSYPGLLSTRKTLADRNLPNCGAGVDLREAAKAAVVNTGAGRFGVISICSTFDDAARAGAASKTVPGRPGLNPLRFSTVYQINPDQMKVLKEIAQATHIDGRRNRSRQGGYTLYPPEGTFGFGESVFEEKAPAGRTSRANPRDMARTRQTIAEARETCGHVVVLAHSHEIRRDTDDEPDAFFEEFCRACIDAGASAVFGTGSHQLKAIELYKGRPIFYSIGNFIFQTDHLTRLPADFGEKYGFPPEWPPRQQLTARSKNGTVGLHSDLNNFLSIAPYLEFEDDRLVKIELLPLALDRQSTLPAIAGKAETGMIYQILDKLSKPYGTGMDLGQNRIFVRPD